jgi:2-oxo-3-hexenedioate decarboxylase
VTAVAELADYLDGAQQQAAAVAQPAEATDLAEAYEVQHALIARRLARGERLAGTKLGFTSRAKMIQMGVSDIIVGQLTDAMQVPEGGSVSLGRFIHPRIEPEVAFRLARDVDPDDPLADVATSVDAVAPALEIIDSRYRDFRFSLPEVVADNTSAAGYVIGAWLPLDGDLGNRSVRLLVDGVDVETGSTAAILGHPLRALGELTRLAAQYGFPLRAGQVVLAGAATAAVPFGASLVEVRVGGLGSASVRGIDD